MCAKKYTKTLEEPKFDPADFPELFDVTADRITYKNTTVPTLNRRNSGTA